MWNSKDGYPRSGPWWAAAQGQKVADDAQASLILLGAAAGVAVTLVNNPASAFAGGRTRAAAAAPIISQLSLFGDVFEQVRADYVRNPTTQADQIAINGMLAGRSTFELHGYQSWTPAGADPRRVRRLRPSVTGRRGYQVVAP
jgi:hypothetical protein